MYLVLCTWTRSGLLELRFSKLRTAKDSRHAIDEISPLRSSPAKRERSGQVNYRFLIWTNMYAKRAKMPNPSVEMAVTGIQNKTVLSALLLNRLVARNEAKRTKAITQNNGVKKLSSVPPTTAANPAALELFTS